MTASDLIADVLLQMSRRRQGKVACQSVGIIASVKESQASRAGSQIGYREAKAA
jgi:hypothetical protein